MNQSLNQSISQSIIQLSFCYSYQSINLKTWNQPHFQSSVLLSFLGQKEVRYHGLRGREQCTRTHAQR